MYVYYKRNTCLYYVCILHTVILCNNKKIIHHSNQGWRLEIKGENVRKHIFVSAIILCTIRQFFFWKVVLDSMAIDFYMVCMWIYVWNMPKNCALLDGTQKAWSFTKKRSQKDMNNNLLLVLIGYRLNWVRE